MIILKRLLISSIVLLFIQCKNNEKEHKAIETEISITKEGVFYKGKRLPFDQDIYKWENIFGKPRIMKITEGSEAIDYIWDNKGIGALFFIGDEARKERKKRVLNVSFYYRNLDSKLGRTGQLGRYLPVQGYSHFLPEDIDKEEEVELSKEEEAIINEAMKDMPKKSDFVLPLYTQKKPISIGGVVIDSTMNVKKINSLLEKVKIEPFYYTPAIGGVNSMNADARFNTTGKYNGIYKTNFGTDRQQYELELVNMLGEVVYIKVRPYSTEEMKDYRENLKSME